MIAVEPDQDSRQQQCAPINKYTHNPAAVSGSILLLSQQLPSLFPFFAFLFFSFSLCCFLGKSTNNSERPFQPHSISIFFFLFYLSTILFFPLPHCPLSRFCCLSFVMICVCISHWNRHYRNTSRSRLVSLLSQQIL